jgi:glucan phosphoethanolaminetransferase (alkaline phosphatase superfamily)
MTFTALPDSETRRRLPAVVVLRLLALGVAACLVVDAWVHLHDAADYDAVRTSVLSQATLFRIEGIVAVALAVALLLWPRRLLWAAAVVVLASALAAVLASTYIDLGQLGPVPDMYEPTWQLPGKLTSAWAEGIGTGLALLGLLVAHLAVLRNRRTA